MVPPRLQSKCKTWRTPQEIVGAIHGLWGGIAYDPCTEPSNPTRATFFVAPPADGLFPPFEDRTWVNPPFGEPEWLLKTMEESEQGYRIGLHLSVSRSETQQFHELFRHEHLSCVLMHKGKLKYNESPKGAMLASWTFFFNQPVDEVARAFIHKGTVLRSYPYGS